MSVEDLTKLVEKATAIKLKGGVFGKTTTLMVVLCICVAAVCIAVRLWWVALVLMLPMMAIVLFSVARCLQFANKNPAAAIMDGAEFLVHEKLTYAQKFGVIQGGQTTLSLDHDRPALSPEAVAAPDTLSPESCPETGTPNGDTH